MQTNMPTFEEFLSTQSYQVPVGGFIVNLVIVAILTLILGKVYIHYGTALSNRRMFAKNFVIISMTTMFIITVVKSSLALSLGLVGALSIVRFRTAIKEPEELAFLFLNIAIGLGLGADQRTITIVATLAILTIIILRKKYIYDPKFDQNLYLTILSQSPNKIELSQIVSSLNKYCISVNLKRFDETNDMLESTFLVKFENFEQIELFKNELNKLSKSIKITFLDHQSTY
ncbi:DUF4956 domain-containing protein [Methanosarcina sp. Mfa9]|uniref:DUF4956 domain-containing protein n=1 Tax=Methanosarcina sp. Mfa9 TaxID=3439063 RepID=UPI003F865D7B